MDNPTHKTENAWVDSKLAGLTPPADWHPNSKRAYAQFQNRWDTDERKAGASWVRLSMAAAILASIGLVVTLLPWHGIWKPAAKNPEIRLEAPRAVKAPILVPEPLPQTATLSQPAIPQPAPSQAQGPEYSDIARRAHIVGTASLQSQSPRPDIVAGAVQTAQEPEQKPAERVGSGVTPPRTIPPMAVPDYTDAARQARVQGNVILDVTIRTDGTGKFNKLVQGLGYGLDEKAIETFEKWRFVPGTKDGQPVDVEIQVTIGFHLY